MQEPAVDADIAPRNERIDIVDGAENEHSPAQRDVVFIHSDAYYRVLSLLPVHPRREIMTLTLLSALSAQYSTSTDRTQPPFGMQFIAPTLATEDQLLRFHARDYVDTLRRTSQPHDRTTQRSLGDGTRTTRHGRPVSDQEREEFELVDDAYVFPGLYDYCRFVAGASITAADALKHLMSQWRGRQEESSSPVAINLGGGRHHALRSQASGFCYVNDVVLAIQRLLSPGNDNRIERVLCLDIDVHHGDGVQEAFYFSPNVTAVSFHMLERAFFPGTGTQHEIGGGRGKNHTVNIPLRRGIVDEQFLHVYQTVVAKAMECIDPDVVVLVCGVDTLARDSLGGFNLTSCGITTCVQRLLAFNRPLLFLGGGGYSGADACRTLAAAVMAVVAPDFMVDDLEVPEHDFYEEYGPDFRMATKPVLHRPNANTDESLALVTEFAIATLERAKRSRSARQDMKRKRS